MAVVLNCSVAKIIYLGSSSLSAITQRSARKKLLKTRKCSESMKSHEAMAYSEKRIHALSDANKRVTKVLHEHTENESSGSNH